MTRLQCDIDNVRYNYNPEPKNNGIEISCNMWKHGNDWIPFCEYRRLKKNNMCGILHRCIGGMKLIIHSGELVVLADHECTDAFPSITSVATALGLDIFGQDNALAKTKDNIDKNDGIMTGADGSKDNQPYLVDGVWICPYVVDYPRGNSYKGETISHEKAIEIEATTKRGKRGQITSLLYDEKKEGFYPRQWMTHVGKDSDIRIKLMPSDDSKTDGREGHLLSVHRSHNIEQNKYLFNATSGLVDTHPRVRDGKQWDGVGGMIGVGQHINYGGELTDFVIKPEERTQSIIDREKENIRLSVQNN